MATDLANITQWIGAGLERIQYVGSTSGRPYATLPVAGSGAGMTRLYGANSVSFNFPEAEIVAVPGDNTVRTAIIFPAQSAPNVQIQTADFQGGFIDYVQGTTADDAQSTYTFYGIDPESPSFPDTFLVITGKAPSTVIGSEGLGYWSVVLPLCNLSYGGATGMQTGPNATFHGYTASLQRVGILPWGESFSDNVSGFVLWSRNIPTFDIFRQNNVATEYALSQSLAPNESAIAFDSAEGGAGSTLSLSAIDDSDDTIDFTAQASGNVTTVVYETGS